MNVRKHNPRRGSVYLAVTGVAMMVAIIGFTSLHLSRLELRMSTSQQDDSYARLLAQSSVEMAVAHIEQHSDWRTRYTSGTEIDVTPGNNFKTLYFKYIDTVDGDLGNNSTDPVTIQGIGRCGNSTYVYNVDYKASATSSQQNNTVLHNYEGGTSTQENVDDTAFLGHHFIPSLPAEATSWGINSIDLWLEQHGATNSTLHVRCYTSDASGIPASLLETVSYTEAELPSSYAWHTVPFAGLTGFTPGAGISFTLEGEGDGNTLTVPYQTGVSQTDAHLLRGGWGGWNPNSGQSMQFRVNGFYTTEAASGEFTITPGSWQRVAAP